HRSAPANAELGIRSRRRVLLNLSVDRQPRVLFLLNHLLAGGAERHVVELIRRGHAKGSFDVDVVLLKPDPSEPSQTPATDLASELENDGLSVQRGWLQHKYDPSVLLRLIQFVRRTQPDIIYTHQGANELFFATVLHAALGKRTVCAVHSMKKTVEGERFSRLQRALMRTSSQVIGIAPS